MTTTSTAQESISATTNSGINNTESQVLSTVVIPEPKSIYNNNDDYDKFSGDFDARVFRDNKKDIFTVEFKDLNGKKGTFHFDLLPAIENRGGGNIRAGDVPEVKPGILRMLETRHKNIVVPGATPVVQSIGIKSALVNLVGCFTGVEGKSAEVKYRNDPLLAKYGDKSDPPTNAYEKATAFHNEVVLPMTQVKVTVQASVGSNGVMKMVYEGVIIKFKDYAVRSNRNYYTIDLLVTSYAAHKISSLSEIDKATQGASEENKQKVIEAEEAVKKAEEKFEKAKSDLTEQSINSNRNDLSAEVQALKEAKEELDKAKEELNKAIETAKTAQEGIKVESNNNQTE